MNQWTSFTPALGDAALPRLICPASIAIAEHWPDQPPTGAIGLLTGKKPSR